MHPLHFNTVVARLYRVVQKAVPLFEFCDNFRNLMYTDFNHFHCWNKKFMALKSKITPATSPLFCNRLT